MTLTEFYKNKTERNGKKFSEILEWSDYKLQVEDDLLFGELSEDDVDIFRKDKEIRNNVLKAVIRMLRFYGYVIVKDDVVQVNKLKRMENGIYIGLYSDTNYKRLTRMMIFLNRIDMKLLSRMIMLSLCYAMRKDKFLRNKFVTSGAINEWFSSQDYLKPYIGRVRLDDSEEIEEEPMSSGEPMSSSEPMSSGEPTSDDEKEDETCSITGLKYTGNSCYQDSTLLALFGIANNFINKNILKKDLSEISDNLRREIKCGDSSSVDLENRQKIQKELVNITKSMRREIPKNERTEYCSNLRKLIEKCPSASKQKFHGTKPQDAGEFVQYLFSIFEVNTLKRSRKTVVSNDLEKDTENVIEVSSTVETGTPIITITAEQIIPDIGIENYISYTEDALFDENNLYKGPDGKLYKRRIETLQVSKTDFLIFYANRLYYNIEKHREDRLYTPILPSEKVGNLSLYAVVVHERAHYTCYIKCDGKWFYYNDISEAIRPAGTFNDVLNEKRWPNVKTHGVLYFYT